MAIPSNSIYPAVMEVVDEIMRLYKSLPPRPSLEKVEAAKAVLRAADSGEELRIQEINKLQKPHDVPEELFNILQEVKKNLVLLQGQEQRREAMYVLELDKRLEVFDELIQKTSKLVSGDDGGGESGKDEERVEAMVMPWFERRRSFSFVKGDVDLKGEFDGSKGVADFGSSLNSEPTLDGRSEKLSLIQVASLIENCARKGTTVVNLQGKLTDQIEWLPMSLGKLQGVTELNLSENRIKALPASIGSLSLLRKLDIHANQLTELPESLGELSTLLELDLHANHLKSLPSTFGNLTSLVSLDLSSNQLPVLPEELGKLRNLKILNVETNELEELPFSIGSCTSLVELRLDFNQLKALPEALGKLVNLEVLTLHYNRIKGLPSTIASLTKLKELDVSFNELETIPESLCFATGLVKLNVGRNFADLKALPRSIGNLEMLEELDISSNQIRVLPDSFQYLSKLRVFKADETPLEVPPRRIVKLGAEAVVQYMADLVAARNTSTRQSTQRRGFWHRICSLCGAQKRDDDAGLVSNV